MKKVVEVNKILILIGFILISLASVSANSGIWISNSELATLPASGTAWLNMKNEADQSSCIPALSNQDDNCNVRVLAQALVFAKLRQETYRTKVVSALTSIVNSGTYNGRSLALGRELGAYVISADLVDLNSFNPTLDTQFRNKIRELLTTPTSGGPVNIEDCHEKRPNNWGTMCGGSRAAVAAYLNDDAKLDRVAQVFKGYLGDRSSYVSFSYGDLSWQCNPSQPVGINPIGCIKEGHSIDGVMPDDQRRCGSFSWPPCNTGYAWEGQQGILFEAIILSRQGYDVWNWEDRAILRAHAWKVNVGNNQAGGDDTWQPWVVNYYYNTNFPAPSPSNPGKNIGWTDWTHQGNAQPLQSCSQQNGLCCGAGFTCSGNAIPSSDCNTICCLGSCQTPPQDTTPPTVSVNHNPTTNIQTTTSVNIIATATDQSGISNIEIFVDGSSRRTCTSSPCSYSSTYNAGSHSYYATARDIPGNQGRDPLTGSKSFNVANPTICTLSTASWSATGPLEEGTQVQLIVNMDQSCNSQQVSFEVREDDEIVGSNFNNADPTGIVIPNAIINNGIATINWNTIWIQDIGGIDEDPEYIFRATLVNNPAQTSDSINELKVNQDATPPTISNIQSNPAVTTATITWTTDDSSSSIVEYGTSSGTYTSTTTGNSGNIHNVLLGNLQMDTNYYFIVRSINNRGFSSQSTERTFRTLVGDVTEQNLRVAFIGDQGLGSNPIAVLNLIRNEGADMVIHAGDFDYQNNPTSFDNQITQVLGANFPYFGTVGNHDTSQWGGSLGYQRKLLDRLARVPGAICTGDYGVKSSCHYKGLFFILSGVGLTGGTSTEHGNYIRDQLAQDNSVWSVCAWHVLMKNMQIGGKGDESGWAPYEECRKAGAIVDTAHEHSYERTLTLTSMQNQIVDTVQHPLVNGIPSNPNNLLVALDRSFVFVSGLGGSSIRSQSRCLPSVYPYSSGAGCNYIWAKIYTSTQQAKYGATFIDFYVDNDPTKARGYFKNINGDVVDTFEIKSRAVGGGPNLPICGNNIIEGTEQCDGSNLNSQTCQSLGFTEGTLRCSSMCTFDTSSCTSTDTIPPIISDVQSTTITSNSATITWTTNEPSDSQIEYGLTTSYGSQTTSNSNLVTSHSQTITGLTASTLYHYRVKSRDISNNLAISGDFTFTTTAISTGTVSVLPTVETGGAHHSGDNADDSLIWLHPSDTSQSVVIGDDKGGGIMVWDLNGAEIQYLESSSLMNNLDLRYNFPLVGAYSNGGTHTSVALVGINNENGNKINFYKVNPSTRMLEPVGSIMLSTNAPYGSCMYHSPITGKYYYFVNWKSGAVQQWEIRDNNGQITGTMVRTFDVGTQVEGCVADDILGKFYIGEESTGVWKYGAEPIDGSSRVQVDRTSNGGHLTADVEGMSIYYTSQGTGYLLVSSQGNSIIAVYTKEGNNNYLGSFRIVANGAIDAVSGSDGIDVTNFPLGNSFSKGIFVVHDASNTGGSASNHKYVPWEEISNKLGLTIDTSWDPRLVGSEQEPGSICGNGICESGESFQNCPADCQTPPQDTTPPTVSVNHNPTTNIQTTTSVNIIATATDQSGISNIEIFVDVSSRRTCTSSPCSYSSTYNAGSHSYYATARDIPGNQGRDPLTGSKSFNVISGTCTTGQWQNQGCGEGSCTSSQMYQTMTVNPNACAVTDQCVSDPSCTTSPVCGNNIREGTEQCDGSDLASQTCQSLGFSSGTLSCSASCTFNTNSCTTGDFSQLTYNLNSGYNFISVPFELQNNNINVLFSSILPQISRIYTYDPTGWGIFRANPNAPSSLTTISTLRGYIIKMKGPASVTLQGTVNNNVQKQLIQGCNLIGITGMNTITVQSALQNLDYDSIWKYDHINNEYTQMNASDLIQPGVGYWIYLNNPGIFNP